MNNKTVLERKKRQSANVSLVYSGPGLGGNVRVIRYVIGNIKLGSE